MGCDDGCGGPAYTQGVDGGRVLLSVGDQMTPQGMQHVTELSMAVDEAYSAMVVGKVQQDGDSFKVDLIVPGLFRRYTISSVAQTPGWMCLSKQWPALYNKYAHVVIAWYEKQENSWVHVQGDKRSLNGDVTLPERIEVDSKEYLVLEAIAVAISKHNENKE